MGFRPFGWGQFGRTPQVPEYECIGTFDEEVCKWCVEYDKCKQLEEDFDEGQIDN